MDQLHVQSPSEDLPLTQVYRETLSERCTLRGAVSGFAAIQVLQQDD